MYNFLAARGGSLFSTNTYSESEDHVSGVSKGCLLLPILARVRLFVSVEKGPCALIVEQLRLSGAGAGKAENDEASGAVGVCPAMQKLRARA